MHEARWNRAKNDAGNQRTRARILRAAISNASNERTSRQWTRTALFEHAVAPEKARAALVEHSALPRWLEGHQASISRFRSRFDRHLSSILRLRGTLERPFRASCGAGPGSSGHFEPPFRARCGSGPGLNAISSHVRLRGRLELGNVGRCGVFEPGRPRNSEAPENPKIPD